MPDPSGLSNAEQPPSQHGWTDRRAEELVGRILQVGVIVSALVVLAGGTMYLAKYGTSVAEHHVFRGEPERLRKVPEILDEAWHLHPRGVIQLGLLLLMLTPVVRVAFTVLVFALQRDRIFIVVTLIVLGVLLYSLLGSRWLPG